jgi:tetratricopeptide (TPR) repeat protein
MAGWAVFLSYVEATHDAETKSLKTALEAAGIQTFRFAEDVPAGEPFNTVLADALLGSRVVVAFLDAVFLERPNCRWELNAVLAAGDLEARLVIARPANRTAADGLGGVPPAIANRRWPQDNETAALVGLVQARLRADPPTLATALGEASASELRARMLETNVLPAPDLLTDIPHAPDPLPASIEDAFVGRSETLWRIDHALRLRHGLGSRVRSTVALEGLGGTGKTRLAREYLRSYGSHYRGGIYWIDATGRVDEQLHSVLRVLDPASPDLVRLRKKGIDLDGYLRRAFETHRPTEPVLWVVDNVPEASLRRNRPRHASALGTFCPLRGDVSLLLTSRVMVSVASQNVERIPVQVLPAEDAVALVTRSVHETGLTREQWEAITDWVGRLPLALALLNAALCAGTIAAAELATRAGNHDAMTPILDTTMAALRDAGLADLEPGALRGVSEAFAISYDLLDGEAQRLLRLLAQLAPDPIPEALLQALGPTVASAEARTVLRTRSFVAPAPGQDAPAFGQIHVVLADFVRTVHRASAGGPGGLSQTMLDLFDPTFLELPRSWSLLNALLPHATTLCDRMDDTDTAENVESAHDLRLRMAVVLTAQGSYARAQVLQERVLEARTRLLGPEHPDTLKAAAHLAITCMALGAYPAARALEDRVLEARTRLLGPEHPDTLRAANNLAVTLNEQTDYSGARELEERVLEGFTRLLGPENPETLGAAHNLAVTRTAQGAYPAARALEDRVLEGRTRLLGPEHPETLRSAGNLASILDASGDHPAARDLEERVLEARTRLLGPEHPDTLRSANNLAVTLNKQNDYPAARELEERVLEAFTRLLGPEHPETLRAAGNLGATLNAQGYHPAARALAERVLEARTRIFGLAHPETLIAAGNLAATLKETSD